MPNPTSPSIHTPPHASDESDPTSLILIIWSVPTLLPLSLPLPCPPSSSLLSALLALARLTPNQPERAWSLIRTYFHARIREASYTGRSSGGVYAVVEEEDVVKAYGSVRRMSVGMGMEVGVQREGDGGEINADGKRRGERKWSIRDEMCGSNTWEEEVDGGAKRVEQASSTSSSPTEVELDDELPPLPAILDMPPRPESKLELPPIYTLTGREEHRVSLETLVEATRGAMRETKLRRREWEHAEERSRLARVKFDEARRLADKLRTEVRRLKGDRNLSF
ncbi:hypothetical protein IQ06DRAFT_380333 [Phaeosphaeriaceae sp. SRC1lsM3a]|nr:hypothetical protein IQ06DRAFT_380333 [Stagonospora sp. SRC1lsM3a]